ncbi:50S ribosomal protein L11 methyltransferase [Desulfobacula sp.]|uniref:50S ribosomal protein L11 methyltransferase n=1 Tax=Desulfobacula sp. TaxID=2593537 RepID=UPI00262D39F6|nr:50S ribosomal protein L11 methyltransferase [Desulfobacula sp.]
MIPFDMEADKAAVLEILYQSDVRLTAQAYIKEIKAKASVSASAAKKIVRQLIDEQELSYHYLYGSTYVEKSFLKPVRITKRYVLTPPGFQTATTPADIDILIAPGISFGSGQHPTTRLCLEAMEACFLENPLGHTTPDLAGADIGTGSGVLAIAMCRSGLTACSAYEIDPVSICEAERNIALNHLTGNITLVETPFEVCRRRFSLICANLRFPTLKAVSDMICSSLTDTGMVILSGVREWEKDALITCYSKKGLDLVWQRDEKKWSGFVFVKKRG